MGMECPTMAVRELWSLLLALLFFHASEFTLALLIHGRRRVSSRSFLFSKDYFVAMLGGIVEHLLESYFLPRLKEHTWISNAGLALILIGELIRKLGILTAWNGFTHDIKTSHHENHKLVTNGVYRLVRHPGYTGFFLWSIGTQLMMCNPFCTIAYAIVTWRFFQTRIVYEEYFLRKFFGSEYEAYARRVPSGIPFIK